MIATGTLLGAYEILGLLGAGGMGEVYRARDTKLGRSVAIKVLPEALASDAERVARLEREAKVLASLNHPHIAALYGLENAEGRPFLIMELVEGETLADRIARGPLKVDEALPIAIQICEALETAHDQGIVHRDLKPANIKLTPDDKVKVLDFGLARAMETAPEAAGAGLTHSPTLSLMATQAGMILGTAAYMSPEQAKGLPADHRSDVFSFGCVLYEMLTGRQAFQGDTTAEMLAGVLKTEPDFTPLPRVHARLAELLRRCIDKNPKKRWQAVGDLRAEVETVLASPGHGPVTAAEPARRWWPLGMFAVSAAMFTGAAAVMATNMWRQPAGEVVRLSLNFPEGERFTQIGRRMFDVSPDGKRVAYIANFKLYAHDLSAETPKLLYAATNPGADHPYAPVFSPDGNSIAYCALGAIWRIPVAGGTPIKVAPVENCPNGIDWSEYGIVFDQRNGILQASPDVGNPQVVVPLKSNERVSAPQMLPGGRHVLFSVRAQTEDGAAQAPRVVVHSSDTGAQKTLIEGGSSPRFVPHGYLLYSSAGTLFAARFDVSDLAVGDPVAMVSGVQQLPTAAQVTLSNTGTLVYMEGDDRSAQQQTLVRVHSTGAADQLPLAVGRYGFPRVSPDGNHLAYVSPDGRDAAIWIYPFDRSSAPRRLTFRGNNTFPLWSHDGRRVLYTSDRDGDPAVFWQLADGSDAPQRLTRPEPGASHSPESMSPDGATLLFHIAKDKQYTLWQRSMGDGAVNRFGTVLSVNPPNATFSRDGHWVAYASESPTDVHSTVYVEPYPATGARYQISRDDDAHHPIWSPRGELWYVPGPAAVLAVPFSSNRTLALGAARPVPIYGIVGLHEGGPQGFRNYDFHPQGDLIGVTFSERLDTGSYSRLRIVLNWFEELKAKVPVN